VPAVDDELPAERVRRAAITLAALAQSGLTYATNDYEVDRYQQVRAVSADLLALVSSRPVDELLFQLELEGDAGYPTPKVDVRGALLDEQERFLLMRERSDGLWSLPGGWADPLDSPVGAVVREIREETGYGAEVVKLVGCWDRDRQGHLPPKVFSVYKLFFLCRATGDVTQPAALETLEIGWFPVDALPPLSIGRVLERQLRRVLEHARDPSLPTELD
jgi:ADP-ribose pyrophosphatase YjhB (NUDIX family)